MKGTSYVAGWSTVILSPDNEVEIRSLEPGKTYTFWNGESFLDGTVVEVERALPTTIVTFDGGKTLFVNDDAEFILSDGTKKLAKELKHADMLEPWHNPNGALDTVIVASTTPGPTIELWYMAEDSHETAMYNGVMITTGGVN